MAVDPNVVWGWHCVMGEHPVVVEAGQDVVWDWGCVMVDQEQYSWQTEHCLEVEEVFLHYEHCQAS